MNNDKNLLKYVDSTLTSIGASLERGKISCPPFKDADIKVGSGICVDKNGEGNPGGLTDDPASPIITIPDEPGMNGVGTFNEYIQVVIIGETNLISPDRENMVPPTMVDEENTDLLLEDLLKVAIGQPNELQRIDTIQKIRDNQRDQIPTNFNVLSVQTNPGTQPPERLFFRFASIWDMLSKSHDKFFSNLISTTRSEGLYELAIVFFYPSSDFDQIIDQMELMLDLGVRRFAVSLTGIFEDPTNPTMNSPQFYVNLETTLIEMAIMRNPEFTGRTIRASARYDSNISQSFNVLNPIDYAMTFFARTLEQSVDQTQQELLDSNKKLRLVVTSVTSASANAGVIFGDAGVSPSTAYTISRLINGKLELSGLQVISRSPLSDIPIEDILNGTIDPSDIDLTTKQITITGSGVSKLRPGDILYEYSFTYQQAVTAIMVCQFRSDLVIEIPGPNSTSIFAKLRYDLPKGGGILNSPETSSLLFISVLRKLDPTTLLDVNEAPPFDQITGNFVYVIEFRFPDRLTGDIVPLPVERYSEFKQLGTVDFFISPGGNLVGSGAVIRIDRS
jgi:hypothetical protein